MSDTVCVKTFQSAAEAEFAKTILESNGIHAMVSADDIGGLVSSLELTEGVRLMVLEEHAKFAAELLEKKHHSGSDD